FGGGSYSMELEAELLHCDAIDLSSASIGGTYTITGNEILVSSSSAYVFCVDEDILILWDRNAASPDMSVLVLARRGS
ncbi:MAG TPA: hypothetical protein VMS65_13475, partial [Polyangiaceae bacterium]|nr:hypothetical protein [Polyangiaceae bacterium]